MTSENTESQLIKSSLTASFFGAAGHGDSERVVAALGHEWHVQGLVGPWRMPPLSNHGNMKHF